MSKSELDYGYTTPKPWLAGYCFLTFLATLILMYAGGFTTTIGAGMAFPDWPLSNGSLNPPGWTTDQAMFAEHGHRLLGATVGALVIGLVVFIHAVERRIWLRRLSWVALGLVVFQGLLGGLRVLWVNIDLAKVHGVTAQVFLCLLASIAIGTSKWWGSISFEKAHSRGEDWKAIRWGGLALCSLVICQLVIGAILRHRGAGMAIPYFPHSAPDGGFLPMSWNWATQINFAHRVMALIIYTGVLVWIYRIRKLSYLVPAMKKLTIAAFLLIHLQILLGGMTIWSGRSPIETTLHVLNGAIFLSVCWSLTFSLFKPLIREIEVGSLESTTETTLKTESSIS